MPARFKARMMGEISIKIKAAQDGFFGLGEDRADTVTDSCYLRAGETYTLRANAAQESGKMVYVFGADKLSVLDIAHQSKRVSTSVLAHYWKN